MTNAERIVSTLDSLLDHKVSLVIYGRAAVVLGFTNPPVEVANSLDVDVILRDSHTPSLDAAFRDVVIPDSVKLRDAYDRARPTVLALAQKAAADGFSLPGR